MLELFNLLHHIGTFFQTSIYMFAVFFFCFFFQIIKKKENLSCLLSTCDLFFLLFTFFLFLIQIFTSHILFLFVFSSNHCSGCLLTLFEAFFSTFSISSQIWLTLCVVDNSAYFFFLGCCFATVCVTMLTTT